MIEIGSCHIHPTAAARNLGAMFDEGMTLQTQVTSICKSAYHQLHNISVARKSLTKEATTTAIQAFVTSKLDSHNALLYGLPKKLTFRIQRIQNAAARLVTGTKRREHITPILKELHWLPVRARVDYKLLLLVYKALTGVAPKYLQDLLQIYVPSRQLRSSNNGPLLKERSLVNLKSAGERSFEWVAPKLWNKLPYALRTAQTVNIFKRGLKTFLFKREYDI